MAKSKQVNLCENRKVMGDFIIPSFYGRKKPGIFKLSTTTYSVFDKICYTRKVWDLSPNNSEVSEGVYICKNQMFPGQCSGRISYGFPSQYDFFRGMLRISGNNPYFSNEKITDTKLISLYVDILIRTFEVGGHNKGMYFFFSDIAGTPLDKEFRTRKDIKGFLSMINPNSSNRVNYYYYIL